MDSNHYINNTLYLNNPLPFMNRNYLKTILSPFNKILKEIKVINEENGIPSNKK